MTQVTKTEVRRRQVRRKNDDAKPPAPKKTAPTGPQIEGRKPGEVKNFRGLLFGPPKTSKTTVACSGEDVLLLSFDPEGDMTETIQGRDDITVVTPSSIKETEDIIRAGYTTDAGRFPWWVVDSTTFLFKLADEGQINKAYVSGSDIRRPYGRAGAIVSQIILDLVNMPDTNIIFTAHLKNDGDKEDVVVATDLGESAVKVAVSPMVWETLGPAVSFIGRTHKKTVYTGEKGKKKKETRYFVSFDDGDRSPSGSRLTGMLAEYDVTEGRFLQELADKLIKGAK